MSQQHHGMNGSSASGSVGGPNPILSHIVTTDGLDRALVRAIVGATTPTANPHPYSADVGAGGGGGPSPSAQNGRGDRPISPSVSGGITSLTRNASTASFTSTGGGGGVGWRAARQHVARGAAVDALVSTLSNNGTDSSRHHRPRSNASSATVSPTLTRRPSSNVTPTTYVGAAALGQHSAVAGRSSLKGSPQTAHAGFPASPAGTPSVCIDPSSGRTTENCPSPAGVECGPSCAKKTVSFAAKAQQGGGGEGEEQSLLGGSLGGGGGGYGGAAPTHHHAADDSHHHQQQQQQQQQHQLSPATIRNNRNAHTNSLGYTPSGHYFVDDEEEEMASHMGDDINAFSDGLHLHAASGGLGLSGIGGLSAMRGIRNMSGYFSETDEDDDDNYYHDFLHEDKEDEDAYMARVLGAGGRPHVARPSVGHGGSHSTMGYGTVNGAEGGVSYFDDGNANATAAAPARASTVGAFFSRIFSFGRNNTKKGSEAAGRSGYEPLSPIGSDPSSPSASPKVEAPPSTTTTGRLINSVFTKDGLLNISTKGVSLKRLVWSREWYFVITGASWPRLFLSCLLLWASIGVVITSLYYAASTYCGAKTSLALSIYFNTVSLAANGGYIGEDKIMTDPNKHPKCFELRTMIVMLASYLNILLVGFIAAATLAKAAAPASLRYRIVFSHVIVARELATASGRPRVANSRAENRWRNVVNVLRVGSMLAKGGKGGKASTQAIADAAAAAAAMNGDAKVMLASLVADEPPVETLDDSVSIRHGKSPSTALMANSGAGSEMMGRSPSRIVVGDDGTTAPSPSTAEEPTGDTKKGLQQHRPLEIATGLDGGLSPLTPRNLPPYHPGLNLNKRHPHATIAAKAFGDLQERDAQRGGAADGGVGVGGGIRSPPSALANYPHLPKDIMTFLLQFRIGNICQTADRAVLSGELRVFLVVLEVVDMRKRSVRSRSYELPWVTLEEDHGDNDDDDNVPEHHHHHQSYHQQQRYGGGGSSTPSVVGEDLRYQRQRSGSVKSTASATSAVGGGYAGGKQQQPNATNVHSHSALSNLTATDLAASKTLRLWFPVNACIALSPYCASRPIRLLYNLLLKHSRQGRHARRNSTTNSNPSSPSNGAAAPTSGIGTPAHGFHSSNPQQRTGSPPPPTNYSGHVPSVMRDYRTGVNTYPYAPDAAFENIFDFQIVVEYHAQDTRTGGSAFVSRHSYGPSDILRKFRFAETCTYLTEATWQHISNQEGISNGASKDGGEGPISSAFTAAMASALPSVEVDFSQFNVVEPDE